MGQTQFVKRLGASREHAQNAAASWLGQAVEDSPTVGTENVGGHAWLVPGQSGSSHRRQRKRIRTAFSELPGLGWAVAEYARGRFALGCPGQPVPENRLPPQL